MPQLIRNGVNDFGYGHIADSSGIVSQFDRMMQQSKLDREKQDAMFAKSLADVDTNGLYSKDQERARNAYNEFRNWAVKNRADKGTREDKIAFQSELANRKNNLLSEIDYMKQRRKEGTDYYKTNNSRFSEEGRKAYQQWLDKPLIDNTGKRDETNYEDWKFNPKVYDALKDITSIMTGTSQKDVQLKSEKNKDGTLKNTKGTVFDPELITSKAKTMFTNSNDFANAVTSFYEANPEVKARYATPADAAGVYAMSLGLPKGFLTKESLKDFEAGKMTKYVANQYEAQSGSRYPKGKAKSGGAGLSKDERQNIIDVFNGATFEPNDKNNALAQSYVGYVKQAADAGGYQTSVRFKNGILTIDGKDKFGDPLEEPIAVIDFKKPGAQGQLSLLFDGLSSASKRLGTNGWSLDESPYKKVLSNTWNTKTAEQEPYNVLPFTPKADFKSNLKGVKTPSKTKQTKVKVPAKTVKQDRSKLGEQTKSIFGN